MTASIKYLVIFISLITITTSNCRVLKPLEQPLPETEKTRPTESQRAILELTEKVRSIQEMFDSGSQDSVRNRYDLNRHSPGGPDPRHH